MALQTTTTPVVHATPVAKVSDQLLQKSWYAMQRSIWHYNNLRIIKPDPGIVLSPILG